MGGWSAPVHPSRRTHGERLIESVNGRVQDECRDLHWLQTLAQALLVVAAWREDCNRVRPHSSLDGKSPNEFARLVQAG